MKSHTDTRWLRFLLAALIGAAIYVGCAPKTPDDAKPLRLGWQPPWANQGQIVEVFKHTDVLARNGVKVEYKAFTYGGPMTEAALAGEIDLLFVGDQPGITLLARDPGWRIIARMTSYRSAFLVPVGSPAKTLQDLKGKKVATAFGSTTHRDTARILTEAGLEIGKDIYLINVDQAEHAALIQRGGAEMWSEVAAIATYDPTIAVSVQSSHARILKEWVCPAVVVAHENTIRGRADALKAFLRAYIQAFPIYANDPERFDALYSQDSRLPLPQAVYRSIAAYEPNLSARRADAVSIVFDASQQQTLQQNADAALRMGIIKRQVDLQRQIDLRLAEAATREIKSIHAQ